MFGSSFARYGSDGRPGSIDKAYEGEEYTLEQLLEDEDLIQELRNLNPRILKLVTPENMTKLLEYVVQEPPPEADDARNYKYPFMSAEVLSCEAKEVTDMFFEPEETKETADIKTDSNSKEDEEQTLVSSIVNGIIDKIYEDSAKGEAEIATEPTEPKSEEKASQKKFPLLEQLLSVLEATEINPVLAGYFLKVFEILLEKRQLDVLGYLFTFKEHIQKMLSHTYDKSIAEAVKKVVSNEDRYFAGTTGEEFLYEKMEIVDQLIDQLDPVNSSQIILNSSSILCSLIEGRQHLAYFNEIKVLKRIFAATTSSNPASLYAGIGYLTALLKLNSVAASVAGGDHFCFMGFDNFQQVEEKPEEELDYTDLMNLAAENLEFFKDFLLSSKVGPKHDTQFGGQITPFGNDRLKVVEFLHTLMQLRNDIFCQKFDELDMPTVLLGLMETYYMNSILHGKIFNIFSDAIHSSIDFLIDMCTISCHLAERILELTENGELEEFKAKGKSGNKAYMVFVTKLSNLLLEAANKRPTVAEYLNAVEKWKEYETGRLNDTNTKENTKLGETRGSEGKIEIEDNILGELEELREDLKDSEQPSEEVRLELPGGRGFSRNPKKPTNNIFEEANDVQDQEMAGGRSSIGGADAETVRVLLEEVTESGDIFSEVKKKQEELQQEEEWGEFQEGQKEPEVNAEEEAATQEKNIEEYASNNYWRTELPYSVEDLESDYA